MKLLQLAEENPHKYGHIPNAILYQQLINEQLKQGNVPGAVNYQKKEQEKRKLLQYGGS